jgi:hypothetical protein
MFHCDTSNGGQRHGRGTSLFLKKLLETDPVEKFSLQGVPYVRARIITYISFNWLEVSKSTLDMMYAYQWTTFTANIRALGQPSTEYCNAQQIAPKTLLLTLTNFRKSKKSQIPNFQIKTVKRLILVLLHAP